MIKRLYFTSLLLLVAITARAVVVTSQPGQLEQVVGDLNVTHLIIHGSIDARDFKFISEKLERIATLDLSSVTIAQYTSTEADGLLGGITTYKAGEIPLCGMAGVTSLTSVNLPSNLKSIGYAAFAGCTALKGVIFPASLKEIDNEAFNSCKSLKAVTIGGMIERVGNGAFARCSSLTSVVVDPGCSLSLGDRAFSACVNLSRLELGAHVVAIGNNAFTGCVNLNSVTISDESMLASIGDEAFYKSGLHSFNFASTPQLTHMGAWSMARTQLSKVELPAGLRSIDEGVFFYDTQLSTIKLPRSLSYLPDYMLAGCDALTTSSFMLQNLGSVGDYALYNQSQHSAITIPFKTYYIGTRAMAGMIGLNTITSEAKEVPELGDDVWGGINKSRVKLGVSSESVNAYKQAPQWKDFFIDVATLRGDINGDGVVTNADVVAERDYLADGNTQGVNVGLTDVNGDGEVDVADITAIYNIINGTEPSGVPQRYHRHDWVMGEGKLDGNYKSTLSLLLHNKRNYTAFQMQLDVPSYITLADARPTSRCLGHQIYLKKQSNGSYLLMGYSPANDDIDGYDGFFVTLQVLSSQHLSSNDHIDIPNTIFVDYEDNVYVFGENSINLSGVSSIEDVTVEVEDGPVDVYNLQGQLIRKGVDRDSATQGLPRGIYIVGGKKVLVR